MKRLVLSSFLSLFVLWDISAQTIYKTECIDPRFKTLTVRNSSNWLLPPAIELGKGECISIGFDLFDEGSEYLNYSLIHCNADWTPSDLSEMEYLDGVNNQEMDLCRGSFNTYATYYHYHLSLPNERVRFSLSGNYVVRFYSPEEPNKTLLTACFYVYEQKVGVETEVSGNTDISYHAEEQQVSLKISYPKFEIRVPDEDLKVFVQQNNRPETRREVKHPLHLSPTLLSYEHNRTLIFDGGNEFRRFEILSTQSIGLNVDYISYEDPYYYAVLFPSESRSNKSYLYDQDQNGRFFIICSNSTDVDVEADYFKVRFSYPTELPFLMGKLYIYGELTGYQIAPQYEMDYKIEEKAYVKDLLLKQGSYNFIYVVVPNDAPQQLISVMEGSHWETENEYLTTVYYHPLGARYDRLIGMDITHSK